MYKDENIATKIFLNAYAVFNRGRAKQLKIKNNFFFKFYNNQNFFLNSEIFLTLKGNVLLTNFRAILTLQSSLLSGLN